MRSVQFVLRHDQQGHFKLASLQSPAAEQLLLSVSALSVHDSAALEIKDSLETVVLMELDAVSGASQMFTRSEAVIRILQTLGEQKKHLALAAFALRLVPASLRNRLYNWVGANRYQWFGKSQQCYLPDEFSDRFLN